MIIRGIEAEERGLLHVAELMCVAARTAPKGKGVDLLETLVVTAEVKQELAEKMKSMSDSPSAAIFGRDALNLEKAGAAVVMGMEVSPLGIPHCGYCGFANCFEMTKGGGVCTFNASNLGIAVASAATVAANHHVDNRIMFTIGRAAIALGLFNKDVRLAYGIPLSVTGKNPFFDR